jgi:hypothetical protein
MQTPGDPSLFACSSGSGTPREAAARALAYLFLVGTEKAAAIILVAASRDGFAILVVTVAGDPA